MFQIKSADSEDNEWEAKDCLLMANIEAFTLKCESSKVFFKLY